uniref:Sulfotransferase domain-containing protein n=1 Tax=Thermodesulfobacterium geofontis TaxID=1295609 RepID=A0A7V5XFA7_9BACT
MRTLILHVGAHKTGSTAIQVFLYKYRNLLQNFGLLYWIEEEITKKGMYGQHNLAWYFTNRTHVFSLDLLERMYFNFMNQISNKNLDVVISSEEFMFLNETSAERLIKDFSPFFDKIYLIIYVRPQVELVLSLYQTYVIHYKGTLDIENWFKGNLKIVDYYNLAKIFQGFNCEVICKPYIRNQFPNNDIVFDFIDTINQILRKNVAVPEDYRSKDLNISVPDFITLMVKYYNSQPSKNKLLPVLRKLGCY